MRHLFESEPFYGRSLRRQGNPRLLLVCFFDPAGPRTVIEHVGRLQRASQFDVEVLNLFPSTNLHLQIPPSYDLDHYEVVFIHSTACYSIENLLSLDRELARGFDQVSSVKVLMKQDEHVAPRQTAEFLRDAKFDVLLTCLAAEEVEKVYPRQVVGAGLEVVHCLTAYTTAEMRERAAPVGGRDIDVFYRGSLQPLSTGRLGYEKHQIGSAFERAAAGSGLVLDISSRWEDRLYGKAWIERLSRSKAVLGCESGANVFDFDGTVARQCADYEAAHAGEDPLSEAYYERAHREFLHAHEGNVQYATISPRHFEAASTRTLQVLYPGSYAGVLEPWRHYVPLNRDFTNLDEVMAVVQDEAARREIVDRAFAEVILAERWTYEAFVRRFDAVIGEALERKGRGTLALPHSGSGRQRAYVLVEGDPAADPRVEWVSRTLQATHDVVEIGVVTTLSAPVVKRVSGGHWRALVPDSAYFGDLAVNGEAGAFTGNPGLAALGGLAATVTSGSAGDVLGGTAYTAKAGMFYSRLRHVLNANTALLRSARGLGAPALVVACDAVPLAAAVALKAETGCRVVYDAHEFWPHSFPVPDPAEEAFWLAYERPLVAAVDVAFAVSPQLAEAMATEYGVPFDWMPNAVPLSDAPSALPSRVAQDGPVRFQFLGGFAEGRGAQLLIEAWHRTPETAHLLLQGPESAYRQRLIERATATGLLGQRIHFLPAAPPDKLLEALTEADVGLIPYQPTSINNRFCSPNKLSQYMAMGLPILANETRFVGETIQDADCGVVVDFAQPDRLVEAVATLSADGALRSRLGRNARAYFETRYHWELFAPRLTGTIAGPDAVDPRTWNDPGPVLEAVMRTVPRTSSHGEVFTLMRRLTRNRQMRMSIMAAMVAQRAWHGVPGLRRTFLRNRRLLAIASRIQAMLTS